MKTKFNKKTKKKRKRKKIKKNYLIIVSSFLNGISTPYGLFNAKNLFHLYIVFIV